MGDFLVGDFLAGDFPAGDLLYAISYLFGVARESFVFCKRRRAQEVVSLARLGLRDEALLATVADRATEEAVLGAGVRASSCESIVRHVGNLPPNIKPLPLYIWVEISRTSEGGGFIFGGGV